MVGKRDEMFGFSAAIYPPGKTYTIDPKTIALIALMGSAGFQPIAQGAFR